jgi:23S rRNA (adenine2503-C2)-methyltransferase
LSAEEIVGQIWNAIASFDNIDRTKDRPVTNVVFMGMGEPLLNFDNVMDSVNLMMDDFAYSISKRRLTISTAGVVPAIDLWVSIRMPQLQSLCTRQMML